MNGKKVVVVGGGIGGLATASLLAKDGYSVTLIEKNSTLGGRARKLETGGFTFDMGPSWYMMPEVFENYFSLFGKKVSDFYKLKRLKTHYRVFFDDGKKIDITSDIKKNLNLFAQFEENGDKKLREILDEAKRVYNKSMESLVFESYKNPFSLVKKDVLLNLISFDLFQSLHNYIKKRIKSPYLQKILEFTTVFLGGSPFNTPAFYKLVAHADFDLGIYYPVGGIYKVVNALESLARSNNVRIILNESVVKVSFSGKSIKKVITNRSSYDSDFVVVNADYAFFETNILPKSFRTYDKDFWNDRVLSPSAFLLYLGFDGNINKSSHHNLYFTSSWERNFDEVYNDPRIPDNPSFYWHIPSKTDSSLAPKGCSSVMILVPISPKVSFSKSSLKNFSDRIIDTFAKINNISNIESKILFKKVFYSKDFIKDYNSFKGSAFGIAHTLSQTAIFRPKNFSKKVDNLFYVGHHTNPGIGMPPVIISSQIVYNLIKNEH
ncbi:MAG: phytoene dehydrogenase [Patescibacteria group bacterium]|nr:MAG: phytoene dehydrogenase [Patescibacteria group bacterium]